MYKESIENDINVCMHFDFHVRYISTLESTTPFIQVPVCFQKIFSPSENFAFYSTLLTEFKSIV